MQLRKENEGRVIAKLLAMVGLACLSFSLGMQGQSGGRVTGTYSNMAFNKESGDVNGQEIRIVVTNNGYEGALQFAEGEPSELIVVPVKIDGPKISFRVPDGFPYSGDFSGSVQNEILKGTFRFKSGATEDVVLKKGKSYWD